MSTSSLRRQVKNIVHNYSEAEIKVREATSNDPWGPSSSLMSEIADLTYNVVAFSEIMSMIWKRLNDHGKNWRHVYKVGVCVCGGPAGQGGRLTGGTAGGRPAFPGFREELEFCVFSVTAANVTSLRMFTLVVFSPCGVRAVVTAVLGCGCRSGCFCLGAQALGH